MWRLIAFFWVPGYFSLNPGCLSTRSCFGCRQSFQHDNDPKQTSTSTKKMVSGEDNQSFTMVISVSGFEPSLNSVLKKSVCMSIYLSIYSSVGTLSVYLSIYLEMLSIEACLRFSIIVSNFVRLYKMWFSTVGGTPSNCRVGNQLYLWNQWKIYNVSICLSWA